jgi:FkbM family methyltransferase
VGPSGRVIAFEPVPETFALLAANVARLPHRNVTLLNAAASDAARVQGMNIPRFDTGLDNFYMAQLTDDAGALSVLCVTIDGLDLHQPVRLVKVDAEGHEVAVLKGMRRVLERDRPLLIVEDSSPEIATFLDGLGYESERHVGSSNRVFHPRNHRRVS